MATMKVVIPGIKAQTPLRRSVASALKDPMVYAIAGRLVILALELRTALPREDVRVRPDADVRLDLFSERDTLSVVEDVLPADDVQADAAVLIEELEEKFGWTSRCQEALSKPDLTDDETKKVLIIWLVSFVMLWTFIAEHLYPVVSDEVQRIDATIGDGGALLALLFLLLLKRK